MTRNGALAGIMVGSVTVIVWSSLKGGLLVIYELAPGFLFSSLAIIIFSLIDKAPSKEIQEEFNKFRTELEQA
jgi:sodium/proline symporter